MKVSGLIRYSLCLSIGIAMLAGCGGSQPLISAPGAIPQTSALATRTNRAHYKVLYSFGAGSNDGALPLAPLIEVKGTLYGTTTEGGAYTCNDYRRTCGTVFSITAAGVEKVLYSFGKSNDGNAPQAGLLDVRGTLYGTTVKGGSYKACYYSATILGCGTVFRITTGGREKVLHSFSNGADGALPVASLIKVKGTLYGTTESGGSYFCSSYATCGTVFSITKNGTENVLHSFGKGADGRNPIASLVKLSGTLYGTTEAGGTQGEGTVFSITTDGTEKVLYSFGAGNDGGFPEAALINVNGTLYGTTSGSNAFPDGTVFSITPSGTEKVLYHFSGGTDGAAPAAPLINVKGTLYGTTGGGGAYNHGTIFSITLDGTEKVLHSFGSGTDGVYPSAGFIDVDGTLYSTTEAGGTYGHGTVFALKP